MAGSALLAKNSICALNIVVETTVQTTAMATQAFHAELESSLISAPKQSNQVSGRWRRRVWGDAKGGAHSAG